MNRNFFTPPINKRGPFIQNTHTIIGEASGSLGDLGTMVPLVTALVLAGSVSPSWSLIWMGVFFIFTGFTLSIPFPIQPMKAIAALAIANSYTPEVVVAAGLMTAGAVFFLTWMGVLTSLQKKVPKSLVVGIQLSLGLQLALIGLRFLGNGPTLGWRGPLLGLLSLTIILVSFRFKTFPAAFILFLLGMGISFSTQPITATQVGIPRLQFITPLLGDFVKGLELAVVQIPLTITNSLLASTALAASLFPRHKQKISSVGYRVALMNFVAPVFGGMPMCHGSGGIAAWHRFGARTGRSMLIFGVTMLFLGLFFSSSFFQMMTNFPLNILGAMLFFVAFGLCSQIRNLTSYRELSVAALIALLGVIVNMVVGLVAGAILYYATSKMWSKKG